MQRRDENVANDAAFQFRRDDRRGRIRAHAAGVRTDVAVADPLVILRAGQYRQRGSVGQRHHRRLFALERLFDQNIFARVAKFAGHHRARDRFFGLRRIGAHQHALARRKTIGLDDQRIVVLFYIFDGAFGIGEDDVIGGRDAVFAQQVLGENLRAFEFRAAIARPETGDAQFVINLVDESQNQRCLRADDDQVRLLQPRQPHQFFNVARCCPGQFDRRAVFAAHQRDTGVARRANQLRHAVALRQFPAQRVLPSARPDHKNFHEI